MMQVPGGSENTYGKVNILLQAYISRHGMDAFSLVSDQAYVAQVMDILTGWSEISSSYWSKKRSFNIFTKEHLIFDTVTVIHVW